jgi:hypothetical protein
MTSLILIILNIFSLAGGYYSSLPPLFSSAFDVLGDLKAVGKSKLSEISLNVYSTSFSIYGSRLSGPISANNGIPTY